MIEQERRRRVRLSVAAYAYEFESDSVMSDAEFDALSKLIDPTIDTDNPELDNFFRKHFTPHTGMWVRYHPDIAGLERIYKTVYK